MMDETEIMEELEYVLSALHNSHDTLACLNEPVQLDFFRESPQVRFYEDDEKLVILIRDQCILKRPVLIKHEDWNDILR
ncbi:hypothetical protein [Arsukibacterium ikkense]|nr:hypothetical protein [Arsukibacterium ikkense]